MAGTIKTFESLPALRWFPRVSREEICGEGGNALWLQSPGLSSAIDPLSFYCDERDLVPERQDFSDMGIKFDGRTVHSGPLFLARIDNARVQNQPFGIFLAENLALAECYHDGWFIDRHALVGIRIPINLTVDSAPQQIVVKAYQDTGDDQIVDEPAIMLTGQWHENYFHWFVDLLPRLWFLQQVPELRALPLVIHEPLLPFQADSLKALGIGPDRLLVMKGRMVRFRTLYFPSYLGNFGYSRLQVEWLRSTMAQALNLPRGEGTDLVYITRRDAGRRRVLNEAEFLPMLQARGFRIAETGRMTLAEQAHLFSTAKFLLAPHGAGCTNVMFMPAGAGLAEFVTPHYPHPVYWILTSLAGCRYGRLLCESSANGVDMIVDPVRLQGLLDRIPD